MKEGIDVSGNCRLLINKKINCDLFWHYDASYKNEIDVWGSSSSLHSKKIFSKDFEYEPWSSWGEAVGMVGVPTKAGAIDIKYYETDYHDGFKGKVRSIGNIEFTYYGNTYTNKNADIVGKFESQTGNDTRLVVH